MSNANRVLTLGEAAERLGVRPGTLRNQALRGKLRAMRPGHDWLVTEAEIERYARENRGRFQPAADVPKPEAAEPPPVVDARSFGVPHPAPKPSHRGTSRRGC